MWVQCVDLLFEPHQHLCYYFKFYMQSKIIPTNFSHFMCAYILSFRLKMVLSKSNDRLEEKVQP